jgi:hypothetical protein
MLHNEQLCKDTEQLVSMAHIEKHVTLVFDVYISRRVMIYASQLVQMAKIRELSDIEQTLYFLFGGKYFA